MGFLGLLSFVIYWKLLNIPCSFKPNISADMIILWGLLTLFWAFTFSKVYSWSQLNFPWGCFDPQLGWRGPEGSFCHRAKWRVWGSHPPRAPAPQSSQPRNSRNLTDPTFTKPQIMDGPGDFQSHGEHFCQYLRTTQISNLLNNNIFLE